MSVNVENVTRVVASCGTIRVQQTELEVVYKLMRRHDGEHYLCTLCEAEIRDLAEIANDLVRYWDEGTSRA